MKKTAGSSAYLDERRKAKARRRAERNARGRAFIRNLDIGNDLKQTALWLPGQLHPEKRRPIST
jgi:hypothetical protein